MKVLFADDDEGMRTLVGHILEENGYEALIAKDGEEALRLFDQHHPDLVLLDVMMPALDGYEVCGRIRSRGLATPVIMVTAKGDIVDKSIGFKAGGDDYVVKPFKPRELMARIKARIRRASQPACAFRVLTDAAILENAPLRRSDKEKLWFIASMWKRRRDCGRRRTSCCGRPGSFSA